ncbi:protease pro-enzyme activation domain-containing protein [Labedaea rhizosphaerae]|uniref:Putative Ig domain-containing protein n=1 Tax=Labedaea rhizosphaerae TaxID=598644 RepID=A0A4R6SDL0_LABRH|nr:protease pro-enzyme activation domain-containing protein [Labedaea rhizosphaerae]TDP98011.1 putative Ig domain-containing protein [Labedaea rhizosphaerae]
MSRLSKSVAAAACLATAVALVVTPAAAAGPSPNPRVPLGPSGSAPAGAHRVGAAAADRQLSLAVALKPRDAAGLQRFVADVSDPASPNYRHYLTSAQYNARYAPLQSDVDKVRDYLRGNGLKVTAVAGNRQVVDAVGTTAQVQAAFGTSIGDYTDTTGKRFYASDNAVSVPQDLAGTVRAVTGLTNREVAHRASGPAGPSGPGGGYTPAQFRTAYSMKNLSSAYNGSGQTVGLIEFDAFKQSDINAWTQYFGQPSVTPEVVAVDGGKPSPGSDQLEVTLDIEAVAATAPGAKQVVYEAPNSDNAWVDEMARIASDNKITILSGSWLNGEKCESAPIQASHDSYTQMAAQGVTMLSASGDWGATGCGYQGDNSTIQADFPPSDPLFTGVGGTQLRTSDSAGTYQSESCWNQGSSGNTRSGGAYSSIFARPDWQPGTNQYRSVPDVALDADYGAGALSVYMNGGWQDVGGTSLSSPLWAGYIAMVNQKAKAAGKGNLGGINPTLYAVAKSAQYSSTFHDVTSGNNGTYSAGTGYDLCTGWGSPQGDNLADPLINGAQPPAANDFSITADPASVSVDPGQAVTTTIKTAVVKGSAQTIALSTSGLPSGVTASFNPTSVTAGGSSTLTLTASSSASPGQSSVTVTGTATDATHTAAVSLTVNGSGQGDFSLSLSPASGTVTAGQSTSTTVKTAAAVNGSAASTGDSATGTQLEGSSPGASPSVVNGSPTTVAKYPFIISEHRTGGVRPQEQSCTGSVVAPRAVLIAAHCKFAQGDPKYLIYGRDNLADTSKGTRIEIAEFRIHPDYSPQDDTGWRNGHDVAIIFTKTDIPVPAGMVYPKIATSADTLPVGTQGTAIGYGKTESSDSGQNTLLREAVLPVIDGQNCKNIDSIFNPATMFCDGYADGHIGLCQGDSGGPYYYNGKIYGVFSWLRTNCMGADVHARLWNDMGDWANQQIGGSPPPPNGDIALSASGLPSGATASFNPTSVSAGGSSTLTIATSASTPAGTYQLTVTGKNATASHNATFTLTVQPGTSGPITVQDPGFPITQHGTPVSLQMHASGGTGSYTWSATGLPTGLSINSSTGLITGTPAPNNRIFDVTVTARDSAGGSGKVVFHWYIY